MEKKMDENKNQMEKLKNSMSTILQTLTGRLPKSDIVISETHENKGSSHDEKTVIIKQFSSGFNSNSGFNYGWVLRVSTFPRLN
jgi:hypothetical protein